MQAHGTKHSWHDVQQSRLRSLKHIHHNDGSRQTTHVPSKSTAITILYFGSFLTLACTPDLIAVEVSLTQHGLEKKARESIAAVPVEILALVLGVISEHNGYKNAWDHNVSQAQHGEGCLGLCQIQDPRKQQLNGCIKGLGNSDLNKHGNLADWHVRSV